MTNPIVGKSQGAGTKNLYSARTYRTTHNSYSGGERGSIWQQLDSGVRCIELDLLGSNSTKIEIGHDVPGDLVSHHHGNPQTNDLSEWLNIIKEWSDVNGKHDPITIFFDLKKYRGENLTPLEHELDKAFPEKLIKPDDDLNALKLLGYDGLVDKIICLHNKIFESTHLFYSPTFYVGDPGDFKSAGKFITFESNDDFKSEDTEKFLADGFAVRVYGLDDGDELSQVPPGITLAATDYPFQRPYQEYQDRNPLLAPEITFQQVTWQRNSDEYDGGKEPSIAINDNGMTVEVHKSANSTDLFYTVGKLSKDKSSTPSLDFERAVFLGVQGVRPMVAICGKEICVVYKLENSTEIRYRTGLLDAAKKTITWANAKKLNVQGTSPSVSMCETAEGKILILVTLMYSSGFHCWTVGEMAKGGNQGVSWGSPNVTDNDDISVPEMDINSKLEITMVWEWKEHIYCRVGVLEKGDQKWEPKWKTVPSHGQPTYPIIYDTGRRPSVALLADGTAIEIHRSADNNGFWSRTGNRSSTVTVWDVSEKVTEGDVSRIAARGGYVMEVHKSVNSDTLWYTLGTYKKR
ncbi:MAG: hypothetical protein QOF89_2637 [Acidobacteriota bacterium]|jgi:hypothetical protein|nr:hypothetical protein [Acidobacteriota bacterium]